MPTVLTAEEKKANYKKLFNYIFNGNPERKSGALEILNKALSLNPEVGTKAERVKLLNRKAYILLLDGQLSDGFNCTQESEEIIAQYSVDPVQESTLFRMKAVLFHQVGLKKKALKTIDRAISFIENKHSPRELVICLLLKMDLLILNNIFEDVLSIQTRVKDLLRKHPFEYYSLQASIGEAKIYYNKGDYDAAIDLFESILSVSPKDKYQSMISAAIVRLGGAYIKSGDITAGETRLFEGIELAKKVDYLMGQLFGYEIYAEHLIEQLRYKEAIETLETFVAIGQDHIEDSIFERLAFCYQTLGDLENVIKTTQRHIEYLKINKLHRIQIDSDKREIKSKILQLENTNESLSEFNYILSHDLLSQVRTINSFSVLLEKRNELSETGLEYLSLIKNGSLRMERMMKDLITYSKSGFESYNKSNVNLNEILSDVKDVYYLDIEQKDVRIESNLLPTAFVDRTMIFQLFQNLIGNAIKYNTSSPPILKVHYDDSQRTISFSDNGIGIRKEIVPQIFKPFQRGENTKEYDGTGIGLALCSKIMERHNGRIWAESQLGKGSIFYLSLPEDTFVKSKKGLSQV